MIGVAEVTQYMTKVELVREAFGRLARGAQQNAAFDIRVSPSLVSSILKGRTIDHERLELLAQWVEARLAEEVPAEAEAELASAE